jgi:hypothetical protein
MALLVTWTMTLVGFVDSFSCGRSCDTHVMISPHQNNTTYISETPCTSISTAWAVFVYMAQIAVSIVAFLVTCSIEPSNMHIMEDTSNLDDSTRYRASRTMLFIVAFMAGIAMIAHSILFVKIGCVGFSLFYGALSPIFNFGIGMVILFLRGHWKGIKFLSSTDETYYHKGWNETNCAHDDDEEGKWDRQQEMSVDGRQPCNKSYLIYLSMVKFWRQESPPLPDEPKPEDPNDAFTLDTESEEDGEDKEAHQINDPTQITSQAYH